MMRGRPKADLVLTDDARVQLTSFAWSRSLPASLSARARIVLSSSDGEANSSIAERHELGKATVLAGGALVSSSAASPGATTTCDPVCREASTTSSWPAGSKRPCTPSHPAARPTGVCARWPPRRASPRAACSATSNFSGCSRIVRRASSCPTRSIFRGGAARCGGPVSKPA